MDEISQEKTKAEFYTDMSVGEILRRGREHYGQSLEDVERNLRIRAIQIHAIETGNIDQLPGKAYALGFVRSYSEYLGLDGEKMVQLFKSQSMGGKIQPNLHFPVPASESKIPALSVAAVLAVLGMVFVGVWMSGRSDNAANAPEIPAAAQEAPPANQVYGPMSTAQGAEAMSASPENSSQQITEETQDVSASADQIASTSSATASTTIESPAAAKPIAAPEKGIILNVKENSWVEIRDATGKAIVSRVLKAGDQYFVPDRPDLSMSLGNASGVEIIMNGKALPVLGRRGEVMRNISLDSKSLKALAGAQ